jgi:hypothetical protein
MNPQVAYITAPDGTKVMSIPDDVRDAVIAYVRDNAKKSPAEIEAIIDAGYRELLAALDGVSETQAAYKAAEDDWAILDVLAHHTSVKQAVGGLMRALAGGALPPGIGPQFEEAKAQDGMIVTRFETLAQAKEAVHAAQDNVVAFVRTIDDTTNADVTFRHFYFGAFNAREWPVFLRVHDADHNPHIGRLKAVPGFPAA